MINNALKLIDPGVTIFVIYVMYTIPVKKIEQIAMKLPVFWLFWAISELVSPDYIVKTVIFEILMFGVIFMH